MKKWALAKSVLDYAFIAKQTFGGDIMAQKTAELPYSEKALGAPAESVPDYAGPRAPEDLA
jgi:hypothetical protein